MGTLGICSIPFFTTTNQDIFRSNRSNRSNVIEMNLRHTLSTAAPPFPPHPSLVITLGVLCCVAQPAALRVILVPPRHETFRRFDYSPLPLPTLLSRRGP